MPSAFFSRGGLQQAIQRRVYEFTPSYFGLNRKNRRIDLLSFQLEARPKGDLAMGHVTILNGSARFNDFKQSQTPDCLSGMYNGALDSVLDALVR